MYECMHAFCMYAYMYAYMYVHYTMDNESRQVHAGSVARIAKKNFACAVYSAL